MKNLLIGSRALNYWHSLDITKPETDWDIISDRPIDGTEWHDPYLLNNFEFEQFANEQYTLNFNGNKLYVLPLSALAIIKRSHLHRTLGFGKHITHYHKHLSRYSQFKNPEHKRLLKERIEMTKIRFPQGYPKLNQSVEDFFDDAVTKVYNHDYLHTLFAFEDYPMYTRLQTDSSSAWCSEELWDKLSHLQKIQCIMEETYVISVERFLAPVKKCSTRLAYFKALEKVCTTLCSGWFRDFAIDNYPELIENYDENRVQLVLQQLK
jgi:hypothetical protein